MSNNIEEIADEFADQFSARDTDGVADLLRLVKTLGGNVMVRLDADEFDESLVIHPDETFTIFIPPYTTGSRDRFTIAHELGHWVLHKDDKRSVFRRYGRGQEETQANRFAAALLMPKGKFEELHRKGRGVHDIAKHFGVSTAAARVRAKVLELD